MRRTFLAGLAALLPSVATAEGPRELETFRDWVVGCDNHLSCTAIGMVGQFDAAIAYVKITREAGVGAEPVVAITALDEFSTGAVELALSLDGGTLPVDRLPGNASENYPSAIVPPALTRAFLDALLSKTALLVRSAAGDPATVSLTGMSAALRWMDATQGRDGSEHALVARGSAKTSSVPEPAAALPVEAIMMTELDPVPASPNGAPQRDEFCNEYATDVAYGLPDGRMIYGACAFNGAYNIGYDYVLVSADRATVEKLDFPGPNAGAGTKDTTLVNPGLSEDGRRFTAFNKGRGLSDCGDSGEWVFDGTAFRLVTYALMPECRGVSPDDWPVLVTLPVE